MPTLVTNAVSSPALSNKVRTSLRFNCGCGAKFTNIQDAEEHALTKRHMLHVLGEVVPPNKLGSSKYTHSE